jgi:tRNA (pseudouridine54-N1)-methyltransferase
MLVSHGVRRDTVLYLVLLGDPERPRCLRISGSAARYLRPDERSLAVTVQKALRAPLEGEGFREVRAGIATAAGGLEQVFPELAGCPLFVLEPGAPDIRTTELGSEDVAFLLGDHVGFPEGAREAWLARGAHSVSVGPIALHTADAITLVANELDRRAAPADPA